MSSAPLPLRALLMPKGLESISALVVLLVSVGAGVAIAVGRDALLPARFSYDSTLIQRLATTGAAKGVDRSYVNTAALYRILGLDHAPLVVALLSLALLVTVVLAAVRAAGGRRLRMHIALLAAVAIVFGSVYLTTYSKDLPVLVVAYVLVRCRGWQGEIALIVAMAAYAYVFRSYWWLLIGIYLALRVAFRLHSRAWVLIASALACMVGFALFIFLVWGLPPDYFRTSVNALRAGDTDAHTMIQSFVTLQEPFGGFTNVLITSVMLCAPVPLLLNGEAYYVVIFGMLLLLWVYFWVAVVGRARILRAASTWVRSVCVIIALVVVQSFFEPDFGSALRHLSPLLACFVLIGSAYSKRPHLAEAFEGGFRRQPGLFTRIIDLPVLAASREGHDRGKR